MAEESITAASPMVDSRKREESVQPDLPTTEKKKKKKRKEAGFLGRVWNGMFGGRGEDYEKRLQYLSKEEAIVHARMKRRAQRWRKMARNVILCSVLAEVSVDTLFVRFLFFSLEFLIIFFGFLLLSTSLFLLIRAIDWISISPSLFTNFYL